MYAFVPTVSPSCDVLLPQLTRSDADAPNVNDIGRTPPSPTWLPRGPSRPRASARRCEPFAIRTTVARARDRSRGAIATDRRGRGRRERPAERPAANDLAAAHTFEPPLANRHS